MRRALLLALVLLLPACAPDRQEWQVAVTAAAGEYSAGSLTLKAPDPWAAARSQEAAVAGVLSTQRLVSAWQELAGAQARPAVLQIGETGYPVRLDQPQIVAGGAVRFTVLSGAPPRQWGPGAVVLTIPSPVRDSVALQAGGWTDTLTAGPGTATAGTLVAAQPAAAAVAMNGQQARAAAVAEALQEMAGKRGYIVALVNRTPVATPVSVTSARLRNGRLWVELGSTAPPPTSFNRVALLLESP